MIGLACSHHLVGEARGSGSDGGGAAGLHVTVNSDDPPYFDAYVTENLLACREALDLSPAEIVQLARNGLQAAFVTEEERRALLARLDTYVAQHAGGLAPAAAS